MSDTNIDQVVIMVVPFNHRDLSTYCSGEIINLLHLFLDDGLLLNSAFLTLLSIGHI